MGTIALGARPSSAWTDPRKRTFLLLNLVGGTAVLATYVAGLSNPAVAAGLWGGVPDALRPVYTINMFLAAAGYFLFTPYIFFRLDPEGLRAFDRPAFRVFTSLYALVLVGSALWLPLTGMLISAPGPVLWWAVRTALFATAIGSVGLVAALWTLEPEAPRGRVMATVGLLPFCLQTAVLDALVWPAFYPVTW